MFAVDRTAGRYGRRYASASPGKVPLLDLYTTSRRAPHIEDSDYLVQSTTEANFSCSCRQCDSEGFTPVAQVPTQSSLARALGSVDRLDQRSVRSLDIVPFSLSPGSSDYVFFSSKGLYVYSSLIMAGALFHEQGSLCLPPFLPGAHSRLSIGTSPLSSGGSLHVAGKHGPGPSGYPETSSPLSAGIRQGGETLSTKSSAFYNSVLSETNPTLTPVLLVMASHSDISNSVCHQMLSTALASMEEGGSFVRQTFATKELVSFTGSASPRMAITGWWTVWSLHPKSAKFSPSDEVIDALVPPPWRLDRRSSVVTSGARVDILVISRDKALPRELLPESEEISSAAVYMAHRSALILSSTNKSAMQNLAPALRNGLLTKGPAPEFYQGFRPGHSQNQRPLSRALCLIEGVVESAPKRRLKRAKDMDITASVRADLLTSERCWQSEPRQGIGTFDPHESMIRVAITAGCFPDVPFPGTTALSRPNMMAWFCTPGRPPVAWSPGRPIGQLIARYRGTSTPSAELSHVSGSAQSIFGQIVDPDGRSPAYPADGMPCFGADWSPTTDVAMESSYVFGSQNPIPDAVMSPHAEQVIDDLGAGILGGSLGVSDFFRLRTSPASKEIRRQVLAAFPSTDHGSATLDEMSSLKDIIRIRANTGSPDSSAHDRMLTILKRV